MPFNHDLMANADSQEVAVTGFSLILPLQDTRPETAAPAIAAMFLLVCERYDLQPQDVFTHTKNLMVHVDRRKGPEFNAIRDYLREEWN